MQRGNTLYVLDEPTKGLHPADVEKLVMQLDGLVESGNTVIVVEHDMRVAAGSDWIMDIGPGAGDEGGRVVAFGTPAEISKSPASRTAPAAAGRIMRDTTSGFSISRIGTDITCHSPACYSCRRWPNIWSISMNRLIKSR